jgi:hypothetical protein
MTIYSSTTNNITVYSGLSTDVKPTSNVMPGSMFIETDTLKQFTYSKTAGWVSYYTKTGLLDGSGSPIGSSGGALYTAAFIWQPSSLSYIHASADASGNLNVTGGGGGSMVYPGAGIANSTGSAWDTSYSTTGSGTVVALATSPTFVTPLLGTPTSGNLTNCTGYTYANLAGTVPTWNQNTTGTAAGLSATLAITSGGTGQTTASAAFNALSPITTTGDLILGNGTNSATRLPIGANTYVLTSNGTTAAWSSLGSGVLAKDIQVYTSGAATYTAPANTQWVKITVVGKGANGGGTTSQRGSGGGAGGVAIKWIPITAGQTLIYFANQVSVPNYVTSGTYTLTADVIAYGGTAGTSVAYAASFTAGGLGGAATGGDINIRGGYGGSAFGTSTSVATQQSGFGGSNMFSAGGYAVGAAINAGIDGTGYGSGGSGSIGSTTVGLGQNGVIIFEAF